jgi:parvulin-like peptidyl-prolyl isomerase
MTLQTVLVAFALAVQGPGVLSDIPAQVIPPKPPADKVVASVNGKAILVADVERLLWDWRSEEVANDLVTYTLIKQAAQRDGVTVSEAEVHKTVDLQVEQVRQSLEDAQDVDAALREQGFTRSRLYLRTEADLLLSKLAEIGFQPSEYIKVSTLMFRPESEQADALQAALTRAQTAFDRLAGGETWERVFSDETADPELQRTRGMLGWRTLEVFPPTVRKELEALKAGGVTRPAQTAYGIQIFRVEAVGHEADTEQLAELRSAFLPIARQNLMTRLRAAAKIERSP